MDDVAWTDSNSGATAHEVATMAPNDWDLHDLSGNVWEWTWDRYDGSYYAGSPPDDPEGPSTGTSRAKRGGGWYVSTGTRVAYRSSGPPDYRFRGIGFRLVRTIPAVVPLLDADSDGSPFRADCDDADDANFPGNAEVCDGQDNDCEGSADFDAAGEVDGDFDGSPSCDDCDDAEAAINPSATEVCDGVDNDCNAVIDEGFDTDGDGETTCAGDCDDGDPAINTSATEACDAADNDCDGLVDLGFDQDGDGVTTCGPDGDPSSPADNDCDDIVASTCPSAPELCDAVDDDCDGAVDAQFDGDGDGTTTCGPDGDATASADNDCDDTDGGAYPGAPETPDDGIDQDCSGSDTVACHVDVDGDGFAGPSTVLEADGDCDEPDRFAAWDDCNDAAASISPAATEVPDDLVDQDCSGTDTVTCFEDLDGDGFGRQDTVVDPLGSCAAVGESAVDTDCDDDDPDAWPGAPEEPTSSTDLNCDGLAGGQDVDGDGFGVDAGDCDDDDPGVYPGATELCNGIDDDCDAATGFVGEDTDADGDGFLACEDCADTLPSAYPGALELCNGFDDDCDGNVAGPLLPDERDLDQDLWLGCLGCAADVQCGDCEDTEATAHPGLAEVCADGLDNDCNGLVDDSSDDDGDGITTCDGDCDDGNPAIAPDLVEICDGLDNDCNQLTDENFDDDGDGVTECGGDCDDSNAAVSPLLAEICTDGIDNNCDDIADIGQDLDQDGFTDCEGDCLDNPSPVTQPPAIARFPGAFEVCDGVDNDCDGDIDEDYDLDGDGWNSCYGDCDDQEPNTYPGAVEVCDGEDQDCDGAIDEAIACGDDDDSSDDDDDATSDDDDGTPDDDDSGDDDDGTPDDDDSGDDDDATKDDDDSGDDDDDTTVDDDDATPVDDDDTSSAAEITLNPPGFVLRCTSTGGGSAGIAALLLLAVAGRRGRSRRRRRRPGRFVSGLLLGLVAVALPPRSALADAATDIAVTAHGVYEEHCAGVESGGTTSGLEALEQVVPVTRTLSQVFDKTGATFLRYWRGVLLACANQDSRAVEDFEAFLADPGNEEDFPSLVLDAKRRLGRLYPTQAKPRPPAPAASFGIGGLFELVADAALVAPYAGLSLDVSVFPSKIVGIQVLARFGLSAPAQTNFGRIATPAQPSLLPVVGGGAVFQFGRTVRPRLGIAFQAGFGDSPYQAAPILPGVLAQFGLELPLGRSPLAIRPGLEIGNLGPAFDLRAGVQLVIRGASIATASAGS